MPPWSAPVLGRFERRSADMVARQNRRATDPEDSQAHVHRRKTDSDAVLHLHSRIADCEESILKLLEAQKHVTDSMTRLTDNMGRIAEVLEAWNNAKGFWLTLKFMSGAAKVLLPILAISGAIWAVVKSGPTLLR